MRTTQTDYWSSSQIRIKVSGPNGPLVRELDKPYALIGTHEQADVVLRGPGIARRHLYLHATADGIFCVDLAKGRRRKSLVGRWIDNDQTVQVGPYTFQFGFVSGAVLQVVDDSVNLLAGKSVGRPFPLLRFSSNDMQLGNHFLTRRLSILGRARSCSLYFRTRSISPEHCVIYQESGEIWIVDLNTASKTRLDGQPVKVASLGNCPLVQIGRITISIQRSPDPAIEKRWTVNEVESIAHENDFEIHSLQLPTAVRNESQPSSEETGFEDSFVEYLPDELAELETDIDSGIHESAETEDLLSPAEYDLEKANLLAEITELKDCLQKLRDESGHRIISMQSQLNEQQLDEESKRQAMEQEVLEFQHRQAEFNKQEEVWQDANQQNEIAHKVAIEQLQQVMQQLANQRLEIQKEQEAVRHNLTESENRVRELADLELQRSQLAEDQARLKVQNDEFEEKQKQWRETQQQQESEVGQQVQKLQNELQQLAADRKALEQVQVEFQQRQQSWLVEQSQMKEQMKMASDQLQERESRMASAAKLEEQQAELVAAQEKLQTDLREFDRYVTIGQTQQQVLDNLKQMKREESSPHRFWSWLLGRKG